MKLVNIESYKMLQEQLAKNPNAYLLLYKSGSKTSVCAYKNALNTEKEDVVFMAADVAKVKDIHIQFGIKTAPVLLSFRDKKLNNSYKGCNDVSFYNSILKQDYFVTKKGHESKPQKRVTVYSTPTCTWCTTIKKHFDHYGIKYSDIDISKDSKAAEEMVRKSGQQGVPQTDINGQMIVGFDKVKINSLLGIK